MEAGFVNSSASRAYYAMFQTAQVYIVCAVLDPAAR